MTLSKYQVTVPRNNFAIIHIYNKIASTPKERWMEGALSFFVALALWVECLFPASAFAEERPAVLAPTTETLSLALRSPDFQTRMNAVNALGRAKDKDGVPHLIEALEDPNPYVRGGAAEALGKMNDARAFAPLREAVQSEDNHLRWGAVDGLRRLGDKRAEKILVQLLGHEDHVTRWKAAFALGVMRAGQATSALFGLYERDDNAMVRRAAAEALGKIGGSGTAARLRSGLAKEKNRAVRRKAEFAIKRANKRAVKKP